MIRLKSVTKIFKSTKDSETVALEDINIDIKEGELIVLRGASGSGKSTILSLIAGLNKPTKGEVSVDNKKISKLSDDFASDYRRDNIGFVFQRYNLIANMSVEDNIMLPLVPLNLSSKEARAKLDEAMEMFHISHKRKELVKNLSGGEQQRVAIARANINRPKIILADEPTANLDERLSLHFIEIIKELKGLNKTVIIATHDSIFFDLDFVDREIKVDNGKIVL